MLHAPASKGAGPSWIRQELKQFGHSARGAAGISLAPVQPYVEHSMTAGNTGTKIAIVTGGSRGLGRNTVINLARRGVSSLFTYRSNQAEADKVVSLVAEAGQKAIALPLDTGMASTFDAFVEQV